MTVRVDQLQVELQRLAPAEGELVVIRPTERLTQQQQELLARRVHDALPPGVQVVLLDVGLHLEHVDPKACEQTARECRRSAAQLGRVADSLELALARLRGD